MKKSRVLMGLIAAAVLLTADIGYRAVAQQDAGPADEPEQQEKERPMMQCPMMQAMKSIELHATSPDVLASRAEQLELTEQQQERLREIAEEAQEKASDILSDTRRQQVEEGPSGRLTPMQLIKLQAKQGNGAAEKDGKAPMCPMCMKMMQKRMQQEERPKGSAK